MKIGIFSPYLDTASGGEKYMLTAAECLSWDNEVLVLLDEKLWKIGWDEIKDKNESVHGLDLSRVRAVKFPLAKVHVLGKLLFIHSLDLMLVNCDGSFSYSSAKKGILHFQLPVKLKKDLWSQIKAMSWSSAIYNSEFTRYYIESQFKFGGQVIYPPVDVGKFKGAEKGKQIVNVGRFVGHGNPKKQDVMIEAFKKLVKLGSLRGWSLHLAGGLMEGNEGWLDKLKRMGEGYEVCFYPNMPLEELQKIYGCSAIYWHAMGFEEVDPKRFEHFGISTVEAMAAGCVPVVINKGGQREIVEDGVSGYLWDDLNQLIEKTLLVIKDTKLRQRLSRQAIVRSKDFSKEAFVNKIHELVYAG